MNNSEANLPKGFYPCCGYVADCSSDLESLAEGIDEPSVPHTGDLTLCLNCGAVLRFSDGPANKARLATRKDIDQCNSRQRRILAKAQHYIRKRGRIIKTQ